MSNSKFRITKCLFYLRHSEFLVQNSIFTRCTELREMTKLALMGFRGPQAPEEHLGGSRVGRRKPDYQRGKGKWILDRQAMS